jgi:Icc-related predicted phosphoesterase
MGGEFVVADLGEFNADPSAGTYVRRPVIAGGVGADEGGLRSGFGGDADGDVSIVVVVVREGSKDALAGEEGRLAVGELFAGIGERQAEIANSFDLIFVGHLALQNIMKILILSDIHGDAKALERLVATPADAYFVAGDLANFSRGLDKLGPILRKASAPVYVMPGNHESEGDIAAFCKHYGFEFFHNRMIEMGGRHIAGLGYSNITPFKTPGEYTEAEIAERLTPWAELKPLVLICHCPPFGTPLDRAGPGKHFGSPAIGRFIDEHQPEWFFCGHIHEAEGVSTTFGATRGVNVGKRGYLLDLD